MHVVVIWKCFGWCFRVLPALFTCAITVGDLSFAQDIEAGSVTITGKQISLAEFRLIPETDYSKVGSSDVASAVIELRNPKTVSKDLGLLAEGVIAVMHIVTVARQGMFCRREK